MTARDTGYAPARWDFDQEVTRVFDDMLARSIPQYRTMRALVREAGTRYLDDGAAIIDLGCSRGEALAGYPGHPRTGIEVSPPMVEAATQRFADDPDVTILPHDLRQPLPLPAGGHQLALAVLTFCFVPVEYRPQLAADARRILKPGGALILVEKVLAPTARLQRVFTDVYWQGKRQAGYTAEEIERKALALEGVLVPLTARWNENLLHEAGFDPVEPFWRCGPFAAWLAENPVR